MKRLATLALTLVVAATLLVPTAATATTTTTAGGDAVLEWNRHAATALFTTAMQPPQQSVPHLAMVHGAVYDAVNAIDDGYEPYLTSPRIARPDDSKEAAVAAAAHRVLVHLLPAQAAILDEQYAASLAAIEDGTAEDRGVAVGEATAAAMIAARRHDGRYGPYRFPTGTDPGVWRPVLPEFVNDPSAWLSEVRPFLVRSASQFRSRGPLALTSAAYARELREVQSVGSAESTVRTADQTHAARYWAENPPATWNRIVRTLATEQDLSLVDNARLFAQVYLTAADALITAWSDKAHRPFWRPITAIREADTDGNRRTDPDSEWLPLIPNPPYPEHPSGHAALSGSIVATLRGFFGTDRISWSDTNSAGLTREFSRLSDAIEEVVDARVWSGIHFRTADEQSARIGRQVAEWRAAHWFAPEHR